MQESASQPPHRRRRALWASALVGVWLAGSAFGFWWYSAKDLRSFVATAQLGAQRFDGAALSAELEAAITTHRDNHAQVADPPTVLHFWDPDCPCSRFNQSHVRQLAEHYRAAGVRFLVLDRRTAAPLDPQRLEASFGPDVAAFAGRELVAGELAIPASPAAAVFDGTGRLAYFGPYSEGAACLAGNGDFVERTLDKLLAGERPREMNTTAFGCFCDWNAHS